MSAFRDVAPPPAVEELVGLLVAGQRPSVGYSGVLAEFDGGDVSRRWRVWRLGDLARVEDPPGRLSLLAGASTYWRSWPIDDGVRVIPRGPENWVDFELSVLINVDAYSYWAQWLNQDAALVERSLTAAVHDGRPAWQFAAPPAKGGTPEFTVDAELGVVVRAEREDRGCYLEWTGLHSEPRLEQAFFKYHE
jgi:hypothetical protein